MRYRLGYSAAGIGRFQAHPLAAPCTDYFDCHKFYLHKQKAPLNSSESRQKGVLGLIDVIGCGEGCHQFWHAEGKGQSEQSHERFGTNTRFPIAIRTALAILANRFLSCAVRMV